MQLEQEFDQAMFKIYYSAKEIGYTASKFFQMLVQHGGLQTARNLINASTISSGYTRLWELKRLDLSVEAVVHENSERHPLFTAEELERCRKRLSEFGYFN